METQQMLLRAIQERRLSLIHIYQPGDGWTVYSEIKRKLTEDYGIPPSAVRFIQAVSYTHLDVYKRQQKLRDHIEAIRTAFILDRENRTATTEERAILQRYCGFGGLKCILNPAKELTDAVRWAKSATKGAKAVKRNIVMVNNNPLIPFILPIPAPATSA